MLNRVFSKASRNKLKLVEQVLLLDEIPNALSDAQTIRILGQIKTVFPDILICMSTHDRQLLKWSDEVGILT